MPPSSNTQPETAAERIVNSGDTPCVSVVGFMRELSAGRGLRCIVSFAVAFVAALLTGVSVMLLIPVLRLSDIGNSSAVSDASGLWLDGLSGFLGVTPGFQSLLLVFLGLSLLQATAFYLRSVVDGKLAHDFCCSLRVQLYSALCLARWEARAGARRTG